MHLIYKKKCFITFPSSSLCFQEKERGIMRHYLSNPSPTNFYLWAPPPLLKNPVQTFAWARLLNTELVKWTRPAVRSWRYACVEFAPLNRYLIFSTFPQNVFYYYITPKGHEYQLKTVSGQRLEWKKGRTDGYTLGGISSKKKINVSIHWRVLKITFSISFNDQKLQIIKIFQPIFI